MTKYVKIEEGPVWTIYYDMENTIVHQELTNPVPIYDSLGRLIGMDYGHCKGYFSNFEDLPENKVHKLVSPLPTLQIKDHPINHWGHGEITKESCETCKVTF